MWTFWLWIFPFIQLKKSVTYRSKKNLEQLKRASSWNGQVTEDIRKYDKRFSMEGFFSSLQNKLAAIHYAESEDEIRAEMNKAIEAGMSDPAPTAQAAWKASPFNGSKPSPEEFILWCASQIDSQ